MPDPAPNPDGNNPSGDTSAAGGEPKTITMTSQQLADRLARAKPADYDDLKARAARLDEIEQANQSEIERANSRATAAEEKAAQVPVMVADALRTHLKAIHDIPDDKAELFLTATDPALLLRQVTALVGEVKKPGNTARREGGNPNPGAGQSDEREFVRNLFNRAD